MLSVVLISCSTRERRPRPLKIETCETVWRKALTRDQFFEGLKGRGVVYGKNFSIDVAVALIHPDHARIEVEGALGVRLALLQINSEYVTLYVPREKTVYRLPTSELKKDTPRRARFLELLPLPVYPEVFFETLLTMSQLQSTTNKVPTCRYNDERNAYEFRMPQEKGGHWVAIDPTRFAPVLIAYFDKHLPSQWADKDPRFQPDFEIHYSDFQGEALASIPSEIELYRKGQKEFRFRWKEAESWRDFSKEVMNWQPGASLKVKNF